MNPVTISQVVRPTGQVVALEIVANDGRVYFVTNDPSWEGLRCNSFPNEKVGDVFGVRLERIEIARLD